MSRFSLVKVSRWWGKLHIASQIFFSIIHETFAAEGGKTEHIHLFISFLNSSVSELFKEVSKSKNVNDFLEQK